MCASCFRLACWLSVCVSDHTDSCAIHHGSVTVLLKLVFLRDTGAFDRVPEGHSPQPSLPGPRPPPHFALMSEPGGPLLWTLGACECVFPHGPADIQSCDSAPRPQQHNGYLLFLMLVSMRPSSS